VAAGGLIAMGTQLDRAEVRRLYAEEKYDEIERARTEGLLDVLLGVHSDDIALLDRAKTGRLGRDDIVRLSGIGRHDLVEMARVDGRIDGV
jgi:hypothetical protein